MSKSWYLHTIDGKPGFYSERSGYICFANRRQNFPILVDDLRNDSTATAPIRVVSVAHGVCRTTLSTATSRFREQGRGRG